MATAIPSLPWDVPHITHKPVCTTLGGGEEKCSCPALLATLGECREGVPLCPLGSLAVLGSLLPASESGGFIFLPQTAKGVLFPYPGGMRGKTDLASCHSIPWRSTIKGCNCSFTKHVFACLSIMQANNTDQRNQNYSLPTALMLMTLGLKLKERLISVKSLIVTLL